VIVVFVIEVCEKDVEFGVTVTELEIMGLSLRAGPGDQMWRPPRVP
jgi:hypothetical protein